MSGFVWRRSLLSLSGLAALLVLAGGILVETTNVPVIVPLVVGLVLAAVQYAAGPWLVQLIVPADVVERTPDGYATDEPVARIVAKACRDAGIPLVLLGIVDDGTPNAFTFGRTRRDARIWLTRGLLERLDENELE